MRTAAALAALVLVAACGERPEPDLGPPPVPSTPTAVAPTPAPNEAVDREQGASGDWREVVSTEDASRLGRLDQAWRLARAEAEDKGFAARVEALGPLVDPNAGLAGGLQPGPGVYRCRTIKLGSNGPGGVAFLEYPWFRCTVELTPGGDLVLTKASGSQRTRGRLHPDTDRRLIFIGAQAWGADETGWPTYGQMPERDQVGVFERVGPDRWRLVIPWPRVEAKLELLELAR